MANNTSYGNVDPLGIGVPNYGKSSYDPIATIRRGWETSRQERIIKDKQRREDYQNFVNSLPTFDDLNNKFAEDLNKEVLDMQEKAYKSYKSGEFSPFVRTDKGENMEKYLSRKQKEITQKYDLYKRYGDMYKQAESIIRDPKNADKIDMEETQQRMSDVINATDMNSWAEAISKNPVVFKMTPIDILGKTKESMDFYTKNAKTTTSTQKGIDPSTGKVIEQKVTGIPEEVQIKAGRNTFKDLYRDKQFKKAIQEEYDNASVEDKSIMIGGERVMLPVEDYFLKRYIPDVGQAVENKYISIDKGDKKGKPQDVTPSVINDQMVWNFGAEPIPYTNELRVQDDYGENIVIPKGKGNITEVGWGEFPDGHKGKYAKLVYTEGSGLTAETKSVMLPYDEYKEFISQYKNLKDIGKLESMQEQVSMKKQPSKYEGLKVETHWYGDKIKDSSGKDVSSELKAEIINFKNDNGYNTLTEALSVLQQQDNQSQQTFKFPGVIKKKFNGQ